MTKKAKFEFEHAMNELETMVQTLEQGELPLDDTLKLFQQGISLTQQCQKALSDAEQQVEMLLKKNGELTTEPYNNDSN